VNKLMCQLSGEVCDGIRPHPITTPKYIREVMLPNVVLGAKRAARQLERFEVAISPLVGVADSDEELAARLDDIRARIAFYASTRTYRPIFEAHGWGDLVDQLHELSVKQRWDEMPKRVSDEVVETIAVVGSYDDIADKIHARYGAFATRIKFSLPIRTPADRERLCTVVRQLQKPPRPDTSALAFAR
jgi:alkanesulfonate monooxygenase SsuD/methylene tetrahydromethanopterin reductase-like flavin-dependent oxidoreductase (luciferase family)